MNGDNKESLALTLARLEVLADSTTQNLGALRAQLAILKGQLMDSRSASLAEALVTETPASGPKDRSRWYLEGKWYNKRNFPIAVFRHYVDGQVSLAALEEMFLSEKVYPTPITGSRKVFKPASEVVGNEKTRYHEDIITTSCGQHILITNQLGINNMPQLIQYMAGVFDFPVRGKQLNPALWPQPPQPPFQEPEVTYLQP